MKREMASACVVLAMAGLAGCSGGGVAASGGGAENVATAVAKGSSTVVADKISVLDTTTTAGAAKLMGALTSQFPTTAEWNKDKTNTYIQDRSTEVFTNVNEILCMVGQTGYVAMTGKGAYKALIDKNLCKGADDASKAGDSSKGDTSGSSAPDYREWVVNSVLNSQGQLESKFWIHEKAEPGQNGQPAKVINAKLVVKKTKDQAPPYGEFKIEFKAYSDDQAHTPMFKGLLETVVDPVTGLVTLNFADAEDNGKFSEPATVTKSSTTSGFGRVQQIENYQQGGAQTYDAKIAFNSDYFLRTGAQLNNCFDRKNFEQSAWRYGLYSFDNGSRFNVKSGIPFNTNADGNSGTYGWIGYWGIWSNGATLTNPQTVYSKNYSNNTVETYVINSYPGKLKKHTKNTTTLDAIKNIPFEGYMEPDPQNSQQMLNYRVIWNGTKLQKIAVAPQNTNGGAPVWTDLTKDGSGNALTPQYVETDQLQFGELNFWSQALGGQVRIKLANCQFVQGTGKTSCDAPVAATPVVFYTEDIVYPGDSVIAKTLTCFDNCPKSIAAEGMTYDSTTGMPSTYPPNYSPGFTGHTYNMDQTAMVLMDGSYPAKLTAVGDVNTWGFNSGALVDLTATDSNNKTYDELLTCDWVQQGQAAQKCGWKAWSLPVFYTWETGSNNWNKLSIVKNASNQVVTFDPPVKVEYTHTQTNANAKDYKYNGVKFFLDYNGFGQLNGIPGKCLDTTTGLEVLDCNGPSKRYVPEFSIESGSTVKNGSTTYYVKALDVEQRMIKKDESVCTAASVTAPAGTINLPSIPQNLDPAIGSEPSGVDVKVIGGIVQ